jgi:regulatory protein
MLRSRRARTSAQGASAPQPRGNAPGASPQAIAIRLLARREYSRAELAACLRKRSVEPDAIEQTLDALVAQGYLSDARYAQVVVAGRSGRFSQRAIAHALSEKRVPTEDAQAALAPLRERDEQADAHSLWERRFGEPPRDQREKARHVRFLLSRGYSMSVALGVLRAAGAPALPDDDTG